MADTQKALSREGHFKIQNQEPELCRRNLASICEARAAASTRGTRANRARGWSHCALCCLKPESDFKIISQWRHSWTIDSASMSTISNWILSTTLLFSAFYRQENQSLERSNDLLWVSPSARGWGELTTHVCLWSSRFFFLLHPPSVPTPTYVWLSDQIRFRWMTHQRVRIKDQSPKNVLPLKSF